MASDTQLQFRGLSSETKPTPATMGIYLPVGSRFVEIDTGDAYDWSGSAWAPAVATWSGDPAAGGGGAPASGALTDRSGAVAAGGAAQQAAAANPDRRYLLFQNQSAGDLWLGLGAAAAATQPALKIPAGGSYEMATFVSTQSVSVYGATTGQAYACKEG